VIRLEQAKIHQYSHSKVSSNVYLDLCFNCQVLLVQNQKSGFIRQNYQAPNTIKQKL